MNPKSEQELRTLARSIIDAERGRAEHRLKQRPADPNEMMQTMKDARQHYSEKANARYSSGADGDASLYKSEAHRIFDDVKNER